MSDENLKATPNLILKDFELESAGNKDRIDEEELLRVLSNRVAELLAQQPEYLFSLLYRLDVDETKVQRIMHPNAAESANVGIARLVIQRQKQRAYTQHYYRPPDLDDIAGW